MLSLYSYSINVPLFTQTNRFYEDCQLGKILGGGDFGVASTAAEASFMKDLDVPHNMAIVKRNMSLAGDYMALQPNNIALS